MTDFAGRLTLADTLESTFIQIFNQVSQHYKIVKYGIESTNLADSHRFIRFSRDATSKFIRYIPDSVIVKTNDPNSDSPTVLIEFKAAVTGVQRDSFLARLRSACPAMTPPFSSKEDVFNIEKDALDLYLDLNRIDVKTVVVAYAHFRPDNSKLMAQFVENIAICNSFNPNTRGENIGSGTWISNVNLASFKDIEIFFENTFGIRPDVLQQVRATVLNAFRRA